MSARSADNMFAKKKTEKIEKQKKKSAQPCGERIGGFVQIFEK